MPDSDHREWRFHSLSYQDMHTATYHGGKAQDRLRKHKRLLNFSKPLPSLLQNRKRQHCRDKFKQALPTTAAGSRGEEARSGWQPASVCHQWEEAVGSAGPGSSTSHMQQLGSCQIHNSHPGWMLNTINPRLDPTCREGNGSLWLNPNTWKHRHRYCPENCH